MYNPDVEELYDLVDIGTPVIVTYETITFVEKPNGLYVRIFADIYDKGTSSRERYHALLVPFLDRYQLIGEPVWPVKVDFAKPYERKIGVPKAGKK